MHLITLTISDDGKASAARKDGGMGLRTMRYRCAGDGRDAVLLPTSKDGAWVRCEVPVLRA